MHNLMKRRIKATYRSFRFGQLAISSNRDWPSCGMRFKVLTQTWQIQSVQRVERLVDAQNAECSRGAPFIGEWNLQSACNTAWRGAQQGRVSRMILREADP